MVPAKFRLYNQLQKLMDDVTKITSIFYNVYDFNDEEKKKKVPENILTELPL